ncbi:hypothetical protein SAMN04244573_04578 [Azotobacter beijerinckii]|uniref:Uncharacterized protein n=1 Tax=Azotobacter beijerinckii TaxID=170623 RepID=A0A1H9T3N6_9GAMM|nr:hypothetical protein SAMN04244573_04578 [Azotobacter beijerinckii]
MDHLPSIRHATQPLHLTGQNCAAADTGSGRHQCGKGRPMAGRSRAGHHTHLPIRTIGSWRALNSPTVSHLCVDLAGFRLRGLRHRRLRPADRRLEGLQFGAYRLRSGCLGAGAVCPSAGTGRADPSLGALCHAEFVVRHGNTLPRCLGVALRFLRPFFCFTHPFATASSSPDQSCRLGPVGFPTSRYAPLRIREYPPAIRD